MDVTEPPSKIVGRELKRVRMRKEWTQDDLAKRMTEIGVPMDRGTVAKIETGKRGVSVDDVFALGCALEVSPIRLLLPHDPYQRVAVSPTRSEQAFMVRLWMSGIHPMVERIGARDAESRERFYYDQRSDDEWRLWHLRIEPIVGTVRNLIEHVVEAKSKNDMQGSVLSLLHALKQEAEDAIREVGRD